MRYLWSSWVILHFCTLVFTASQVLDFENGRYGSVPSNNLISGHGQTQGQDADPGPEAPVTGAEKEQRLLVLLGEGKCSAAKNY